MVEAASLAVASSAEVLCGGAVSAAVAVCVVVTFAPNAPRDARQYPVVFSLLSVICSDFAACFARARTAVTKLVVITASVAFVCGSLMAALGKPVAGCAVAGFVLGALSCRELHRIHSTPASVSDKPKVD
eukprot:TRINITY_DN27465_c0_g1_i1.p2 TRINITY_DN27465_c0_g1~~TRINITY_DN27465_c0_g1_i1.p2  ORF type:complete len:148 (+),score=45.86 TRINITY_DN27465_c0_g1_i1:55-444(+)